MPIQLDKILADISNEKVLRPNYPDASKKDIDDAWARVGKNNKLSVHEARSIFKVLQKKYDQEKAKESSSWKLFNIMDEIHRRVDISADVKAEDECDLPMEEDEEYEMLEVQEEEEPGLHGHTLPPTSTGSISDNESPTKSNSSSAGSSENDDKNLNKITTRTINVTPATLTSSIYTNVTSTATEEKKLLNTLASGTSRQISNTTNAQSPAMAALNKKGITLKKTTGTTSTSANTLLAKTQCAGTNTTVKVRAGSQLLEVGKTITLPESLKRKLTEEQQLAASQAKKINVISSASPSTVLTNATTTTINTARNQTSTIPQQITTTAQLMAVKQEREDQLNDAHSNVNPLGINLITIPGNPVHTDLVNGIISGTGGGGPSSSTAATVASTSTNGYSPPRIEDMDFKNEIIFDPATGINNVNNKTNGTPTEIINLGNFDNSLPPTFFKNLCNSSRHEALGLYLANAMNRLRPRSAAKLELAVLRAIIDVKCDEMEQYTQ